ncbi:unnamed protein product [Dicrocoelium dendriticum]|nr:unnamed protein product [Dicrocoelium dendriticum]
MHVKRLPTRPSSLPVLQNASEIDEESVITKFPGIYIKTRSLTRVDDQSNSAAPTRRQPHPFAMQALGMRPTLTGRTTRLPEWPPPDPPPLTPLNLGVGRNILTPLTTNPNQTVWPPRPWWRRINPARPAEPVVHVTIGTIEATNSLSVRLEERPARVTWRNTSEEVDVEQGVELEEDEEALEPQHAFWSEVEENTFENRSHSVVTTTTRAIEPTNSTINQPSRINSRTSLIFTHTDPSSFSRNLQSPYGEDDGVEVSNAAIQLDEEIAPFRSDEQQEESSFQDYFFAVDSNPAMHMGFTFTEPVSFRVSLQQSSRVQGEGVINLESQSNLEDSLSTEH